MLGGCDDHTVLSSVLYHDFANDTWFAAPPMLRPRSDPSAVVFHGCIVVSGGFSATGELIKQCEEFSPALGTWRDIVIGMEDTLQDTLQYFGMTIFPNPDDVAAQPVHN